MKKGFIVAIVVVAVAAIAGYKWTIYQRNHPKQFLIKMPSGQVIEATRSPRMDLAESQKVVRTSLEGKLELIAERDYAKSSSSRLVMITNTGDMIILLNPEFVNKLRLGGSVGKIVKLNGYWQGVVDFKGKSYRTLFIESM